MSLDSGSPRPRGPLAWSIKTALIVGLGATALAHQIAKPAAPPIEPEVTGSIGTGAQAMRLDPCALRGSLGPTARN
ncbi:MAG TPA: hypothetical protein VGU70_03520 [Methylobacterium sp.]|jgi:hypothetical protein|uniref:hypothetical protein n=1 Tax=Methylorubrum sp. B1-46 TaxID=2897334 RepID=UPI001E3FB753|nr:hypothetical protein [Methylorubrum sp. B1-46]UGB25229.1 hypothetical protein LPC10_20380 [Methylorubrum sp. B1-46]HEV2541817.1 hypothetical protein [Methylobacterium sp.]